MKLFLIVVLPLIVAASPADPDLVRALQEADDNLKPIDQLFEDFMIVFDRGYEDAVEEDIRSKIFESNVKYIREHNQRYRNNKTTFSLGINQFSDLTHKEFLAMYTTDLIRPDVSACINFPFLPPLDVLPEIEFPMFNEEISSQDFSIFNDSTFLSSDIPIPPSVDLRKYGYVTPVKNEGQCRSSWAFSATGSLEGQHFRKTKELVSLSEQQLVDCSSSYGNYGCNGGLQSLAYDYIQAVGGIVGEQDYPYYSKFYWNSASANCFVNMKLVRATVTDWSCASRTGNERDLQIAVATVGPIAVSIDASKRSFRFYRGGVYYEPYCSNNSLDLDHAVLAVGYGSVDGSDYWLVKNSWGTEWGDKGYVRMARNRNNNCGIATMTVFPNVFPNVSKSLGLNVAYNPSVSLTSLILCYVNVRSYIG